MAVAYAGRQELMTSAIYVYIFSFKFEPLL